MLMRTFLVLVWTLRSVALLSSTNTQCRKWNLRCNNCGNRQQANFITGISTGVAQRTTGLRSIGPLYAKSKDIKAGGLVSRLLSSTKKKRTAGESTQQSSTSNGERKEWESMTVPELKILLKSKKLKVSGTKKELLLRLEENESAFTAADEAEIDTQEEENEQAVSTIQTRPISNTPLGQIYASDMDAVIKTKIGELESEAYESNEDNDDDVERDFIHPSVSSSSSSGSAIIEPENASDDDSYEDDYDDEEEDLGGGDPNKTNVFDFDDFDELESYMEEGGKHLDKTAILEPLKEKSPNPSRRSSSTSGNRLGLGENFQNGSQDEIQALIDRRTNARKSVDFATADAIKIQLEEEYGVEIFDSLGIWKSANGRTGRLASLDELSDTPCTLPEKEVQILVIQRTIARRNRNFQLADEIRQQLTVAGVELNDPENTWRSFDGAISGFQSKDYDKKSSSENRDQFIDYECKLTQEEAQDLIDKRTECRRNMDYETADAIKAELKASGIDVVDRQNTWSALDGSISGFQQSLRASSQTRDDAAFEKRRQENPDPPKLNADQVQKLVDIRTKARRNRNYDLADSIEEDLHKAGIFLNSRANTWKAYDGSIEGFQSTDYNVDKPLEEMRNIPCTLNEDEAQELVDQRAEARSRRDFDMADEIKQQLIQSGIGLFDNENRWVAFDRSISGAIPLYEMQAIPCTLTLEEVQAMIGDRTAARRVRDFRTADAIKKDLMEGGIQLFDRDNKWQAYDGSLEGVQSKDFKGGSRNRETGENSYYRTEPIQCTLSVDEIQELVDERTVARRRRNFDIADEIREELASKGVEMVDKENIWRTFDRSLSGMQSDGYGSGNGRRQRTPPIWARDREDEESKQIQWNTKFDESEDDGGDKRDDTDVNDDDFVDSFMDDLLDTTSDDTDEDGVWVD